MTAREHSLNLCCAQENQGEVSFRQVFDQTGEPLGAHAFRREIEWTWYNENLDRIWAAILAFREGS